MSAIKSELKVNCTQGGLVQNRSVLKTLIKELRLIRTPSSLWGLHLDCNKKCLAFSVLNISYGSLKSSKSVVLSETDDYALQTNVFMNNKLVDIPYISKNVTNVNELENLLMAVDTVGFCKHYVSSDNENLCSIFNLPFMDVCSQCVNRTSNKVANFRKDLPETGDTDMNQLHDITFSNSQKNGTNKVDNIQCILCKKIFNIEESLSKHYKDHLLKDDNGYFECTICLSSFDDVNAILEHYSKYHGSVKFIKCSVCIKKFTNVQQLRRHIRNHSGYEAFTCGRCLKDFISKQKQKTHTCIKSTATLFTSKLHICSVCNTRYTTNYLLQQHQREHQIHVSLKCKECNKKFENQDDAAYHKMHCKKKRLRYACSMCAKQFSCASQRLCHIKKVHPLHI